jgi:hypothetical protein
MRCGRDTVGRNCGRRRKKLAALKKNGRMDLRKGVNNCRRMRSLEGS